MAKPLKTTKVSKSPDAKETNLIRRVTLKAPNKNVQTFTPGDTVNVHVKVREGEKERVQVYKGIVTRLQGKGPTRCFTVRKMSAGVGVERTFPFSSPIVDKVELLATGKVRRAKLYYLRGLQGKAAKIESEINMQKNDKKSAAEVADTAAE